MSNIISFQEAKARRDEAKLTAPAPVSQVERVQPHKLTVMKDLSLSGGPESLFVREAMRFRFSRIDNPPAFVIMKTSILPPAFPPDQPPPLVA